MNLPRQLPQWCLAVLLGWVGCGRVLAQPAAPPVVTGDNYHEPTECVRWKVFYLDSRLGVVIGDAAVDWKYQFAEVNFPYGGQKYHLESQLFSPPRDGDPRCQFRFAGPSPDGTTTAPPDTSHARKLPGPADATVKIDAERDTYAFGVPTVPDNGTVDVEMAVDGDGDMQGRWSYAADPVTQHDASGGGRTGRFSMAPDGSFGGQQSGSELWVQQRPEIYDAVVVDHQLEIPHYLSGVADPTGLADRRTIFVVGRNLPFVVRKGSSENLGRLAASVGDEVYAYHGTAGDSGLSADDRVRIRRGWMAVCRDIKDPAERARVLALDCALIQARVKPGFIPGMREFVWSSLRIPWRLESRDARAEVAFVRDVGLPGFPSQWERTTEAYLPESVAMEVRLPAPIPFESFTVKLQPIAPGPDGNDVAVGPEQDLVASRVDDQLYRTAPLQISRTAGNGIVVPPGAELVAHVDANGGLLSFPATTSLRAAAPPDGEPSLWDAYLRRAAKTQGLTVADPRSLEGHIEKDIPHTLILLLDRLHTEITFSDHAAMLLLRDTFVDAMRRADVSMGGAVGTDDGALGYAKLARALLRANPKSAIATLPAGTLQGQAVTLAEAVDPDRLFLAFDDPKQRDAWLVVAVRTAVAEYRRDLRQSLAKAEAIDDGDIPGLLYLTGDGFDLVVARALPRLMQYSDRTKAWAPDRGARGYAAALNNKFKELRASEEASKIDTTAVIGMAGAALALPTMLTESATAYYIAAAGNGVMSLTNTGANLLQEFNAKGDIAFAYGASPVLGDARYQEAVLADPGWKQTLGFIAVDTALTTLGVRTDLRKAQAALRIARGEEVAARTALSIYGLSKLPENEQRDLLAFLANARALRAQGRALTGIQSSAVSALDGLGQLAARDPETLAKGLALTGRVREAQEQITRLLEQAVAASEPKEVINGLRLRQTIVTDLWHATEKDPRVLAKVTDFDVGWMSGAITKPDEARALALAAAHGNNWHDLKNAFMDGRISGAEMHNFVSHREDLVKGLLDQSIAEVSAAVERETGQKPNLFKRALGSTNLTSDLDYSVYGEGAERVVKVFNDKFRALPQFGGLESGFVLDSNVYTQAVYELFRRDVLVGKSLGIANADLDALRQIMYEQMATRKYIGGAEAWQKHTSALLAAAPDEATRKMWAFTFEEADYAYQSAQEAIAKELGVAGADALHAAEGSNALLRATNNSYVKLLDDIGQWRREMTRLQQLMTGEAGRLPAAAPEFMDRYPGWKAGLAELQRLQALPDQHAEFEALAKTWSDRLAYQLRKKQGEALFYASEAYQDEATILHVVSDLQETGRAKLITPEKLAGGAASRASQVLSRIDGRGALNSMMENLANLRKELNHADDAARAAAKGGKYFIRVLDAGHEAGIDVSGLLGKDLVEQTIEVDRLRASVDKVGEFLKASGTSNEAYVQALEAAHERLGVEMVKHKDITDMASRVRSLFDEMPGAAEAAEKSAPLGEKP